MTIQNLLELGLTPKEAELYLACLELGPSKASDIAGYTDLNRGTIYDVAKSLFKKGLLSTTQKRNITHFVPHPPDQYIQSMQQQAGSAQSLLPTIEAMLSNSQYRPTVQFFEGPEGIKQVYEETLKCRSKKIAAFLSTREVMEAVGRDFLRYYVDKRIRRHIHIRVLNDPQGNMPEGEAGYPTQTNAEALKEVRMGPVSIDIAGNCMIFDDSVAIMSTKRENFGTIIQSREYATMTRNIFDTLWENA